MAKELRKENWDDKQLFLLYIKPLFYFKGLVHSKMKILSNRSHSPLTTIVFFPTMVVNGE